MSGHRVVAIRGDVAPATIAALLGMPSNAAPHTTDAMMGFLAPNNDGAFAVGRVGDWTVAWAGLAFGNDSPERDLEARRATLTTTSRGGEALHWLTESVTGTDGFEWFVDGSLIRSWWMVESVVVERVGVPVRGEPEVGLDAMAPYDIDEWVIAGVVEALVAPWDTLVGGVYRRVEVR